MAIADALATAAIALVLGAGAQDRGAGEILAEIDAIEWPGLLSGKPDDEVRRMVDAATARECALAEELVRRFPDHPRAAAEALRRWTLMQNVFRDFAAVYAETGALDPGAPAALAGAAAYARAWSAVQLDAVAPARRIQLVDAAVAADPPDGDDGWRAALLVDLATTGLGAPADQKAALRRVLADHRKSTSARNALEFLKTLKVVGTAPAWRELQQVGGPPLGNDAGGPVILAFFSYWSLSEGDADWAALAPLKALAADATPAAPLVAGVLMDAEVDAPALASRLEARGLAFPVLHDAARGGAPSLSDSFAFAGRPWFVLLDRDGKVQRIAKRAAALLEPAAAR